MQYMFLIQFLYIAVSG